MRILIALSILVLAGPLGGCMSRFAPFAEASPPGLRRTAAAPATLTNGTHQAPTSSYLMLGVN